MTELYVKLHKWADNIESILTGWAMETVHDWFGIEDTDMMTEDQYNKLVEYVDENSDTSYDWVLIGFRNIISAWENNRDDND